MAILKFLNKFLSHIVGGLIALQFFVGVNSIAATDPLVKIVSKHFPKCQIQKKLLYFSHDEQKKISTLSDADFSNGIVTSFNVTCDKKTIRAYMDTEVVRTHNQTILVSVLKDQIDGIYTLNFAEPVEYKSNPRWLTQFFGKKLTKNLQLKQDIDVVTGATLTSRSTTNLVRKCLAIHKISSTQSL